MRRGKEGENGQSCRTEKLLYLSVASHDQYDLKALSRKLFEE
jgi:hypothetical protein